MRASVVQPDDKPSLDSVLNNLNAASIDPIHSRNDQVRKKVIFPDEREDEADVNEEPTNTSVESITGESDIDDVPDCDNVIVVRREKLKSLDLSTILQGNRYHNLSLFFGPMACCFWIAM